MTINLLFITITVRLSKNNRSLYQELDAKRKRELIEDIEYKKSDNIHY
ncbi:hypothetical protein [Alkalihalobacillus sp. R86527]